MFPNVSNPMPAEVGGGFFTGSSGSGRTTMGNLISGSEEYLISSRNCGKHVILLELHYIICVQHTFFFSKSGIKDVKRTLEQYRIKIIKYD